MYHVLIILFDDTYIYQEKLRQRAPIQIDLRFMSGTKFMCAFDRLKIIENKIPPIQSSINFIGKGDYHYVSYIFLKRINEPFVLLVIDNHIDMKYSDKNFIRCDSWLYNAGLLKNLRQIYYINSQKINKIFKTELPIYLSIDKDIIDNRYLKTRWTQGTTSPQQLVDFILNIISFNRVIGIDICGEPELIIEELKKSEEINLSIIECIKTLNFKQSA
ncbi:MAG: hypothetical protein RMI30_05525 [Thermodesulfovibrio sp.]|nr:hypothetical protein [Thermodesulfovibrio sp.]MDW7998898.1 hypothetical protein [Thermodesulfovibrio sp.]